MQNGMMSGPQQQQGHTQMHHGSVMHPPQASPLDSQGGHSPTSSNTSQTPQTTPTSVSSAGGQQASRDVPKICGRPGCTNPVQRSPDGWQSDFCSNECVVGQCREVYTSWSSSAQHQPVPPPHHHHQHHHGPYMGQPQPQQQPPQPQQQTAVVK